MAFIGFMLYEIKQGKVFFLGHPVLQYYKVILQYCKVILLYYKVKLQYYKVILWYCMRAQLVFSFSFFLWPSLNYFGTETKAKLFFNCKLPIINIAHDDANIAGVFYIYIC
jgi:hypothetical protein